ncbi:MAG TPA: twin-arginine translocase subunit TatC [bacterium]|nr:twin-arginine translocase subunit TatC [bacterium]
MPEPFQDRPLYITQHLTELRKGIVHALIATGIGVGLAFWKSDWLFFALLQPFRSALEKFPEMKAQVHTLQTLAPIEAFMINMKLATVAGLALASPFILREIWVFASPALKSNERTGILMVFFLGLFFFGAGLAFGYYLIIPLALQFLIHYNLDYQFIPQWTLQGYFSFLMNFLLIFGLVFELPLVLAALVAIGVATPAFLSQKRKHAIIGIFVLAAFIAPSADPVTQTLVAVPLVVLYEIGIWLSYLSVRKK